MANEEIVGGPFEVYLAPVGTVAPPIQDPVPVPWAIFGVGGNRNISEAGIRVTHGITGEAWRALGTTSARKWFPTSEDLGFAFELADMSAEMYAAALGKPASDVVATPASAGVAPIDTVIIERGFTVNQFAMLVRGDQSPAGAGFNTQWWCPLVVQTGNPEIVIVKGAPQMLAFNWMALYHTTLGLGSYIVQTGAEGV